MKSVITPEYGVTIDARMSMGMIMGFVEKIDFFLNYLSGK